MSYWIGNWNLSFRKRGTSWWASILDSVERWGLDWNTGWTAKQCLNATNEKQTISNWNQYLNGITNESTTHDCFNALTSYECISVAYVNKNRLIVELDERERILITQLTADVDFAMTAKANITHIQLSMNITFICVRKWLANKLTRTNEMASKLFNFLVDCTYDCYCCNDTSCCI